MREDLFGAPMDPAAEAELQRLLDKFEWAVCDPDTIEQCRQAHVDCPDRLDFNPYRPPRGETARRQLENTNVAEWGHVMLRCSHEADVDQGTAGAEASPSGPFVVRGHCVRMQPAPDHTPENAQRYHGEPAPAEVVEQLARLLLADASAGEEVHQGEPTLPVPPREALHHRRQRRGTPSTGE